MLQAVDHFLTGIEGGGLVVVNDGDHRQARERCRSQVGHVGDAVQLHFERNRDLLLDLLGRVAGPLGDDLRIGVGDVGVGLNGKIVK